MFEYSTRVSIDSRRSERRSRQTVLPDVSLRVGLQCALHSGTVARAAGGERTRGASTSEAAAAARRRHRARQGDGRAARTAEQRESVHAARRDAPLPRGARALQAFGRTFRAHSPAPRERCARAHRPAAQLWGASSLSCSTLSQLTNTVQYKYCSNTCV